MAEAKTIDYSKLPSDEVLDGLIKHSQDLSYFNCAKQSHPDIDFKGAIKFAKDCMKSAKEALLNRCSYHKTEQEIKDYCFARVVQLEQLRKSICDPENGLSEQTRMSELNSACGRINEYVTLLHNMGYSKELDAYKKAHGIED